MIFELNAWTLAEERCSKDVRLALNTKYTMRRRFMLIQRAASASSTTAENDGQAGPSRSPTEGQYSF
jgi:hypothetical protein